jgi:NADPH-dependent 2,4-dienoyl-CoA reductase/sulfur reductase-like enzyme
MPGVFTRSLRTLVDCSSMKQPSSPAKHVVVVGAGFAGLAAARTLLDRAPKGSVHVTVLEAADRAGGRARTVVVSQTLLGTFMQGLGELLSCALLPTRTSEGYMYPISALS